MSIDTNNNLVTVKGGIDVNALTEVLEDKLNRKVEIVQQKDGGSGGKKKGKGGSVGGDETEGGGGERRMEEHKMENIYYVRQRQGQGQYMYPQYINGPDYMYNYMDATQMFNDENPNACVVM